MDAKRLFVIVMLICHSSTFKIERDYLDITHGYTQCGGFIRTTGGWWTCTCKEEFTTMMSENNTEYNCLTPKEVGCDYNLQEDLQAYLITKSSLKTAVVPNNFTNDNFTIHGIYIWSYDLYVGHWVDITYESSLNFAIDHQGKEFSISNLDLSKWGGHVVKIMFNDKKCLVVKVKGSIIHPYDVDAFKRLLKKTVTTAVPQTTHQIITKSKSTPHKSDPKITTTMTKTTKSKSITEKKTETLPKVTTMGIISSKTPTKTISTRKKTLSTQKQTRPKTIISSTVKTGRKTVGTSPTTLPSSNATHARQLGSHSPSSEVYIVIAVVIAIALALVILFIYQRRRSANKKALEYAVNKVIGSGISPDAPKVNKAYEADLTPCFYNKTTEQVNVGGNNVNIDKDNVVLKTSPNEPAYECFK